MRLGYGNVAVCLSVVLVAIFMWFYGKQCVDVTAYYLNLYGHSKSLPYSTATFVGREKEMEEMIQLVDFGNPNPQIVSIVGPPGIGKSTLTIHVGHDMVAQGVVVHYVDMVEVSSMQALAEKVLESDSDLVSTKNVTVDRLYRWARELHHKTLLILDNCDDILHAQKETLQKTVKKVRDSSPQLKILMTSRQRTMQLRLQMYPLHELHTDAACSLLQSFSKNLNSTLCESIANLTGNIPLALQVIGALLNQPDPPDPMTIIHNLDKQLISTLSPAELPTEERVNASISLSYQYLDGKLQKFGRYFANFPGSFSKETTCEIMLSFAQNPITCSYIFKSIYNLVQRSLLEYNQRSGRYQFHRLIREFFLDIQRSSGNDEVVRFSKGFRKNYANKLMHLSKQFQIDHKAALATLDIERHNIQHFLEEFEASHTSINDADYLSMVRAVAIALDTHYLNCRFTPQEMFGPLRAILIHIDDKLRPVSPRKDMPTYVPMHINIVIKLARLEEELNGTEIALQTVLAHKQTVERMESYEILSGHDYARFYIQLSKYYMALDEHDGVRQCHARILKKTENELKYCSVKSCSYSYLSIATASYFANSYEDSIHFLHLVLKTHDLSTIPRALLIRRLLVSYQAINDHDMAQATLEDFIAIFPSLMSVPPTEIFQNNLYLQEIIRGYRNYGRTEEALALEERQIEVIQEFGVRPSVETVIKTVELVVQLLHQQNYSKAADLAKFGIESLKQLSEEQETLSLRLELQIIIARAKMKTGKFSEGLDDAERVVDFIYEHEHGPSLFARQLSKVCGYVAVFRLRFGCVVGDYDVLEIALSGGIGLVVRIFEVLLDLDVSKEPDVSQNDAQIIQQSPSKDLSVKTNELSLYTASLNFSQPGSSLLNYAFDTILTNARWLVQLKVIRFQINVLWVIGKVILVYCILRCIRCCICLPCKTMYFIARVIDLCVCLIAIHLLNVYVAL